jgi:hypothetical protein
MKLALTLFAALALVGCAHAPEPLRSTSGLSARDYYPLAVGNTWTYQAKMLGDQRVVTVKILRQANGFFEDSQGAKLTEDAEGLRDDKRYLLKNPLRDGAEWDNVVSVSAREHYRILQADAPCEVPAGHFEHCVTVESQTKTAEVTLVNTLTFAPHVGIVRLSIHADTHGKQIPQTEFALSGFVAPASVAPAAAAPGAGTPQAAR